MNVVIPDKQSSVVFRFNAVRGGDDPLRSDQSSAAEREVGRRPEHRLPRPVAVLGSRSSYDPGVRSDATWTCCMENPIGYGLSRAVKSTMGFRVYPQQILTMCRRKCDNENAHTTVESLFSSQWPQRSFVALRCKWQKVQNYLQFSQNRIGFGIFASHWFSFVTLSRPITPRTTGASEFKCHWRIRSALICSFLEISQ